MDRSPFLSYLVNKVLIQGLLVLGIVLVGFFVIEDAVARFDLTEDNRFSISEASHELASSLESPLTIRAYFSDNIPPRIEPLQQQVFDVLAEYEAHGEGRIKIERRDPLTSTAAESEAKNYGVQPVVLRVYEATQASSLQVYGGIVLVYEDRESEVINIAERYNQGYEGLSVLEYEISSRIWQLTNEKPKLGITGYLERQAAGGNPFQRQGGRPQPEFQSLRRLLGEAFEIETVNLKEDDLDPEEMPLLLVVRPKDFADVEIFRLDQYLMKGGRVLMFVTQGTIESSPFQGQGWHYKPFKTGLDAWLEHHGVRVPNEFVCHWVNAMPIEVSEIVDVEGFGRVRMPRPRPNWFFPLIGAEGALNQDNPAVQMLDSIVLLWPHPVDVLDSKLDGKDATILVQSHEQESWRWKDLNRVDRRMLDRRADRPNASQFRASPVAVAIEGRFKSYFADRPAPPSVAGASKDEEKGDEDEEKPDEESEEKPEEEGEEKQDEEKAKIDVVKESEAPTQLVVIGNAMFISDPALQQLSDDQAKQTGLLAFNLVDWLARSKKLIALRAKRYSNRLLVDEDHEEYLEEQQQLLRDGEIDEDTFATRIAEANERQQARWKTQRWLNILLPCGVIVVAGFVVLIVRTTRRSRSIPPPPAAEKAEETQLPEESEA